MKESFGRFGIPDLLFSDNGPCYSSSEFEKFAEEWDLKHVTSSPMYPRSNGFSERNVKIIKDFYSKSGDKQMGSLIHRSTQLENDIYSIIAQSVVMFQCSLSDTK